MSTEIVVALIGAVPATIAGVAAWRGHKETKAVKAQLVPNGGNSVRDAIDQVGHDVGQLKKAQEVDRELLLGTAEVIAHLLPPRGSRA